MPADKPKGLRYGGQILGKHLFRMREQHVADHLIPLMKGHATGAAKLDIVLRGVALQEAHTGKRAVGIVLPRYTWEELYDLARSTKTLGSAPADLDAPREVIRLKRKWVGRQLARLEELNLVKRIPQPGKRPKLLVLRDDGSGEPLDDPDGKEGNTYVTMLGSVIASRTLARWGTPELSAYLAAMAAERQTLPGPRRSNRQTGGGKWFRALGWFADAGRRYGPPERVQLPFSVPTLERGIARLEEEELLAHDRILVNPHNGRRLQGPRNLYTNRFDSLDKSTPVLEPDEYTEQLDLETS